MTPAITWSIVGLLIGAKYVSRWYWQSRLDRALRIQQFRDGFAQTRRDAIRLLYMKQLDPKSATFGFMYVVSSSLVRRTHAYPAVAKSVITSLADSNYRSDSEVTRKMEREMRTWTPDVREVFIELNGNVKQMVIDTHAPLRIVMKLDRLHLLRPLKFVLRPLKFVIDRFSSVRDAKHVADEGDRLEQSARSAPYGLAAVT